MEKKRYKKVVFHVCVAVGVLFTYAANLHGQPTQQEAMTIPISGNTWQRPSETHMLDRTMGILGGEPGVSFDTYVRFKEKGAIGVALQLGAVQEESMLCLSVNGDERRFIVTPARANQLVSAGTFQVADTGYVRMTLTSLQQGKLPAVRSYQIEGEQSVLGGLQFVRDNQDNYYYWGRRGHLCIFPIRFLLRRMLNIITMS